MASRIFIMLAALFIRRLLIEYIGNEVNGLNSLYASIIGMLSVAELGVGSAIVFSMYRPIVEGNKQTVEALYALYRRLYRIIGIVILAGGLAVMPFLPRLISDYDTLNINIYLTFFLTLISVVLTYFYSAKTSLIEAHKNNYITTGIMTISRMLMYLMQIVSIVVWRSFVLYITCQIIETLLVWGITEAVVRKMYPDIIKTHAMPEAGLLSKVARNIKAMFMHKIGAVAINAIDGLIISAFLGVAVLGRYSNYAVLAGAVEGLLALFFKPLTSVIGHLCAKGDTDEIQRYFSYFYSFNLAVGIFAFLGMSALFDNMISLMFGNGLVMPREVVLVITLNCFVSYLRNSQLLFRDSTGTFYYDRWKPFAESIVNLILSVLLVKIFPQEYAVAGVIAATIATSLLICDIVEPHILYKYVFRKSATRFYQRNYTNIAVFTAGMLVVNKLMIRSEGIIREMAVNAGMSILVSMGVTVLIGIIDREFGKFCRTVIKRIAVRTMQ